MLPKRCFHWLSDGTTLLWRLLRWYLDIIYSRSTNPTKPWWCELCCSILPPSAKRYQFRYVFSGVYLKHIFLAVLLYRLLSALLLFLKIKARHLSHSGDKDWNDERSSFHFAKQVIATVVGIQVKKSFERTKQKQNSWFWNWIKTNTLSNRFHLENRNALELFRTL